MRIKISVKTTTTKLLPNAKYLGKEKLFKKWYNHTRYKVRHIHTFLTTMKHA